MLLDSMLPRIIRFGRLGVIDAAGKSHVFEGAPGPVATVRLRDPALSWKLLVRPLLYVPEAYMDGALTIEEGSLYDLIDLLGANDTALPHSLLLRLGNAVTRIVRHIHQHNPIPRARRNAAPHYDLSDQLYELFLDRDRQYSCAYFRSPDDDLATAQHNKKRHIAAKLLLSPGQRVLDIGSGWGGLALYLAGECDVEVTGLTLSQEQLKVAQRRAAAAGCAFTCATTARRPGITTASSRSACSSMSGSSNTGRSSASSTSCSRPTASRSCIRSAAWTGRARPMRGCANTSFPAAIRRPCPRSCRWSNGCGCGSPISRSCGCITPRPCAPGADASSRIATASERFMTSAFAGCGKCIWWAPRSRSGAAAAWCSRCKWPRRSGPCP